MRSLLLIAAETPALRAAFAAGPEGVVLESGSAGQAPAFALPARDGRQLYVQIGPLTRPDVQSQLEAAMVWRPDGILLRGAVGARDVQQLGAMLAVGEALHGLPDGGTAILAAATDTAAGCLALPSLPGSSPRLGGLLWDGERLAAALGCTAEAGAIGQARSGTVLAAAAAGVPAYAWLGGGDAVELAISAQRDGFAGYLARIPGGSHDALVPDLTMREPETHKD